MGCLVNNLGRNQQGEMTRLSMLNSQFEELQMKEDETVESFNRKLRDIVNKAHQLGE